MRTYERIMSNIFTIDVNFVHNESVKSNGFEWFFGFSYRFGIEVIGHVECEVCRLCWDEPTTPREISSSGSVAEDKDLVFEIMIYVRPISEFLYGSRYAQISTDKHPIIATQIRAYRATLQPWNAYYFKCQNKFRSLNFYSNRPITANRVLWLVLEKQFIYIC